MKRTPLQPLRKKGKRKAAKGGKKRGPNEGRIDPLEQKKSTFFQEEEGEKKKRN